MSVAGELSKQSETLRTELDNFLRTLRDIGRETAETWLAANFEKLGVESTVDLREQFL